MGECVWVRGCSCMCMGVRLLVRLCVLYIHLILTIDNN